MAKVSLMILEVVEVDQQQNQWLTGSRRMQDC
jgi:hypothetical protein